MSVQSPHYLLFSEASDIAQPGRWRFVVRSSDGSERMTADDVEPDARGERLELLTVVRGLEALDQPSKVTLMTRSVYVREGIRYGLSEWRENGWRWESFGQMIPVKHRDLWERVDRALRFHEVECRTLRFDHSHSVQWKSPSEGMPAEMPAGAPTARRRLVWHRLMRVLDWCRQRVVESVCVGNRTRRTRRTRGQPWHRATNLGKLVPMVRNLGAVVSEVVEDPQEEWLRTA